jgi:hypothetical protein
MYILYASQNGNAEQIAKEIYNEIKDTPVDIYSLDESLSIFKTKQFDRLQRVMERFLFLVKNGGNLSKIEPSIKIISQICIFAFLQLEIAIIIIFAVQEKKSTED